jgi:hypothetical protein
MGHRQADDDGFTYTYGVSPRSTDEGPCGLCRCIRNDKRSVKAKEAPRIRKDGEGGGEV